MNGLLRTTAAGLFAAATSLAFAADAAAQGSSSSGGTSSRGTGSGSPSMSAPNPGTPQRGTVSPGTSSTGTTSQGERGAAGSPAPGDTSGGTIGAAPGETGRPSQNRPPAPTIVDRGSGTTSLATMPSSQVQTLQSALNRAGIGVAVDGVMGPETQRALRQYQRDNGLPVTGELDGPTRARLDLGG